MKRLCAVRIQATFRCWVARKAFLQKRKRSAAAVVLQAAHRRVATQRILRSAVAATAVIQRAFRRHRVRCHLAAVVKLQAAQRRIQAQRSFRRTVAAAVVIQTAYRRHTARRSFQRAVAAAVRIQAATRTRIARRAYRHDLARWVRVQAFRRGHRARTSALAQRRDESARKVQRAVRVWLIVRTFFQAFDGPPALGSTLLVGSPGLPSSLPTPTGLSGTVWGEWLRTLTPRE